MPNHCENDLYIDAPYGHPEAAAQVDEVLRYIGCDPDAPAFDFDRVVPQPAAIRECTDGAWYRWCIDHWGTKWNAYEVTYERVRADRALVRFRTAWGPPKPIFEALATKFPHMGLCLEYFERGMEFCGGMHRRAPDDDEPQPVEQWQGEYKGVRGG